VRHIEWEEEVKFLEIFQVKFLKIFKVVPSWLGKWGVRHVEWQK